MLVVQKSMFWKPWNEHNRLMRFFYKKRFHTLNSKCIFMMKYHPWKFKTTNYFITSTIRNTCRLYYAANNKDIMYVHVCFLFGALLGIFINVMKDVIRQLPPSETLVFKFKQLCNLGVFQSMFFFMTIKRKSTAGNTTFWNLFYFSIFR